jgi:peptide/nickel transport system substrate-binding protein
MRNRVFASCLAAAALIALSSFAHADKAHDTLRFAVDQPIRLLDGYLTPNPEADLVDRAIYDTLVGYDVATRTYHGQLAESWKQIDDKTMEFKLRHGVKFHDGIEMTADDVIYSFQYGMDPNVNFLFKDSRFGWIDHVDKVDDYTIRVTAKQPTAIMLARLWSAPEILPKHIHAQLADKSTFGLHPVGTGPYKVQSYEPASGTIVLVKNPDYNWGGYEPAGKIGRVEVSTIPDAQTRMAKMMVGDLDLIFNVDYTQAKDMAASNPEGQDRPRADRVVFLCPLRYRRPLRHPCLQGQARARGGDARDQHQGHPRRTAAAGIRGKAADAGDVPSRSRRLHLQRGAGDL